MYPNIKAVFVNTGLEYPEIVLFVKTFDNVDIIRPKKNFKWVIENVGYPVISKKQAMFIGYLQNPTDKNKNMRELIVNGVTTNGNKCTAYLLSKKYYPLINAPFKISSRCCDILKKEPFHRYEKQNRSYPIIGIMPSDGQRRKFVLKDQPCNLYDSRRPISRPFKNWNEQDIFKYIIKYNLKISPIYGEIVQNYRKKYTTTLYKRTGCMFCMFGVHLEKGENRFQRMSITHPLQYKFCMENLGLKEVLKYMKIPYEPFKLKGFNL